MKYSIQIVRGPDEAEVRREMAAAGVEPAGIEIMTPKMGQWRIKIKNLRPQPANIIKQQALGAGGEAALAYGAVNLSVENTDLILAATSAQLKHILEKMKLQGFDLPALAIQLEKDINNYENFPPGLELGGRVFDLKTRTLVMGILNVTPDSFYDGGRNNRPDAALKITGEMLAAGADLIDVGGASSRPGSEPVSAEEELNRVLPVIEKIHREFSALISVDTTRSSVAAAAVKSGAAVINDISALRFDEKMAEVVKTSGAALILMHLQGSPKNMQENPQYADVVPEIIDFFKERIEFCRAAGISEEKIIVDPGIGFGKNLEHNLKILKNLASFKSLGRPILLGHSRKSFLGKILELEPDDRLEGSLAVAALAVMAGVNIIRTHDASETIRVVKTILAIKAGG